MEALSTLNGYKKSTLQETVLLKSSNKLLAHLKAKLKGMSTNIRLYVWEKSIASIYLYWRELAHEFFLFIRHKGKCFTFKTLKVFKSQFLNELHWCCWWSLKLWDWDPLFLCSLKKELFKCLFPTTLYYSND